MIPAPAELEGLIGIYAIVPNSKRLGGFIPESSYVFVDINSKPVAGDLAVCIDSDFSEMATDETTKAQIVSLRQDSHGKLYGHVSNPEEKITGKTMHKVIMIVMK